MDILALDLSKSGTGWARYVTGEARPTYGTWKLGTGLTDDVGTMRNLFARWQEITAFGEPDVVWIERPLDPRAQKFGGEILIKIAGGVEMLCGIRRIRIHNVANQTWKSTQLKGGRMTTEQAKARSLKLARDLGMNPLNDNESDALHILDYACERELITTPWRADLMPALDGVK